MTAPSTRPIRKKTGRLRAASEADRAAAVAARSRRTSPDGDDRARAPIRTRGLTKEYGDLVAVDHLDLEVQAGEIFGLLGQNGAGKTTTILMLLGLTEPTAGQARVVGLDPARHPLEVKRRVGYLPDAVGFYGDMSGRDNLRYTARLNRIPRAEADPAIDLALEQVGLAARADSPTDTYSRGMLQRLGIADALIKDPDVLILDEPTT
ncbi:MAG: type transport system ATP-binding protein, partial [Chloroflexota bacterium]|nr:type transport system ATP-binding protein [Chloroflexota bacterium]